MTRVESGVLEMRSPYIYHQWRLQKFLRMVFGNIYVLPLETTTVYIKKLSITWVGYIGLTCGLIFGLDVQICWVGCSNIFGGCSRKAKLKYYMYSINFWEVFKCPPLARGGAATIYHVRFLEGSNP